LTSGFSKKKFVFIKVDVHLKHVLHPLFLRYRK